MNENRPRENLTIVARLVHDGVSQARTEHVLREICRECNDAMRSALRESNEALVALGCGRVTHPDAARD
jgi:hypothetical protein